MTPREGAIDRERRDLVTRQVMDESRLIRFVAGPDGSVVPDLARKLPGRGLWVAANREAVDMAAKKGLFARAAKAPLKAAPDLADMVERLLTRRCLEQLGLARREGVLISGFEKAAAAIRSGRAAWLVEAADGAADGRGKLLNLARQCERAIALGSWSELRAALNHSLLEIVDAELPWASVLLETLRLAPEEAHVP